MISLEIINLLPKQQHPHILTHKLNHIQRVREARSVPRKPILTISASAYITPVTHPSPRFV